MSVLTPADHEHFLEHGFVVMRDAVPPEVVADAVEALERGGSRQQNGVVFDPTVEKCVTDEVLAAIAELFGADYPFDESREAFDIPRPYKPEAAASWERIAQGDGLHNDNVYPTLIADLFAIGMFIFLTKVHHRGGAFMYSPGSPYVWRASLQRGHKADQLPDRACKPGTAHYHGAQLVEFLAEPGDVLLRHTDMGHAGSQNVAVPQTRHAVTRLYRPCRRIDPARKPFDHLSTIEKASSVRYLRDRFGPHFLTYDVPTDSEAAGALRDGLGRGVIAHAHTRYAGRQHRWWVEASEPALVRHAVSTDWVRWTQFQPIAASTDVRSLHHHAVSMVDVAADGDDAFLTISSEDATFIYSTEDYEQWTLVGRRRGMGARSIVSAGAAEKAAAGQHLFAPDPADRRSVLRVTTDSLKHVDDTLTPSPVATAPAAVHDVSVDAVVGEREFVMLLDIADGDVTRPWFVHSTDAGLFTEEEPQPLRFDTSTPPSRIRVYERAHRYWLVTYLRDGRISYGAIDWLEPSPRIQELSTPEALDRALQIVGLV